MAPFLPYMAEHIWMSLGNKESVHLQDWPTFNAKELDEQLMTDMDIARQIVELGLSARDEAQIKVRQPLALLEYSVKHLDEQLEQIIADELNVREVIFVKQISEQLVVKEYTPVKIGLNTKIDESLKLEGLVRELTRQINNLRKEKGLTIHDKIKLSYNSSGADLKKLFASPELVEKLKQSTLTLSVEEGPGEHALKVNDEELLVTIG
jgi:isoleucyl-tRNA synthetase